MTRARGRVRGNRDSVLHIGSERHANNAVKPSSNCQWLCVVSKFRLSSDIIVGQDILRNFIEHDILRKLRFWKYVIVLVIY